MLSPLLLERLRAWWRVGHAQGKILPNGWLFPGLDPMDPLTARQLNRAIHAGRRRRRDRQARVDAHAAPRLRHPPAGAEGRHPRDPGPARATRSWRPRRIYTHVATDRAARGDQPAGRPAASVGRRRGAGRPGGRRHLPRSTGPPGAQAQRGHLSLGQLKVMSAIEQCRSAALGGHVLRCEGCGTDQISYNSCRNRHCPKCQSSAAKRWLDARQADLLPVEYYHVVFTLPAPIADIAYQNKAVIYGLLFDVAAETLLTHRRRSQAPGRAHRRDARAAHLGLGADAPPARARHRARRRAGARRQALDRLPAGVLPAGAGALAAVPAALPGRTAAGCTRRGKLQFFGEHAALADAQAFKRVAGADAPVRVGGLCQAARNRELAIPGVISRTPLCEGRAQVAWERRHPRPFLLHIICRAPRCPAVGS